MGARRIVETWNDSHQVGARVLLRHENGSTSVTWTTSRALLADHEPAVFVFGVSGVVLLERLIDCCPTCGRKLKSTAPPMVACEPCQNAADVESQLFRFVSRGRSAQDAIDEIVKKARI